MNIRSQQVETFQDSGDRSFVKRACDYLRLKYPKLTDELTRAELQAMVANGVTRARSHGLAWESSLIRFIELMLVISPNFDEQPGICLRLRDMSLPEDRRIDALLQSTSYAEWEKAARFYNPQAWGLDINEHPALIDLHGAIRV